MKQIKMFALGIGAALLLSSAIATASSATPLTAEFWQHGTAITPPVTFKGKSATAILETKAFSIECATSVKTGFASSATVVKEVRFHFEKCKENRFNTSCKGGGGGAGEIITKLMKGRLGGIKQTPTNEVRLLLEPEAGGTMPDLEIECFPTPEGKVQDQAIGLTTPIGKEETKFKVKYGCASVGIQSIGLFEGETEPHNFVFFEASKKKTCA